MATQEGGTAAIVNPASRDGALGREWPKIQQLLKENGIECEVFLTEYAGHGSEIAFSLKSRPTPPSLVIAFGGDGTMNEVARGLRGSSIVFGLFPYGSGNDYARAHGIPVGDHRACIAILKGGVDRSVAAIRVQAQPAPFSHGIQSPMPTAWDGAADPPASAAPSSAAVPGEVVVRWAFLECDVGLTAAVGNAAERPYFPYDLWATLHFRSSTTFRELYALLASGFPRGREREREGKSGCVKNRGRKFWILARAEPVVQPHGQIASSLLSLYRTFTPMALLRSLVSLLR